jgi:cation transport ATPase
LGTDKTGTLTKGSFELHDIVVMPGQLEKRPRIDLGIWRVMELQNTMILA